MRRGERFTLWVPAAQDSPAEGDARTASLTIVGLVEALGISSDPCRRVITVGRHRRRTSVRSIGWSGSSTHFEEPHLIGQ